LPDTYVAGQGGCVQRDGRIHIERRLADTWVGGDVSTVVTGTIDL
jgi:predicted PhzF superfamily epimerase YddE/YHI9